MSHNSGLGCGCAACQIAFGRLAPILADLAALPPIGCSDAERAVYVFCIVQQVMMPLYRKVLDDDQFASMVRALGQEVGVTAATVLEHDGRIQGFIAHHSGVAAVRH